MRYLTTFGMVALTMAFWNPGTSAVAQPNPAAYQQNHDQGGWQNDDHRDRDRDGNRDGNRGDRDNDQGRAGDGTYTQTCREIERNGDTITASCEKKNGHWRRTSLSDYRQCTSQIINDNGRLKCTK